MLYREIIAVCSEIHTKHINTVCGQNVEFVTIKNAGTNSDYWALKSYGGPCPLSLCFLDLQRVEKIGNYEQSRQQNYKSCTH